jgi:hypothetical protein
MFAVLACVRASVCDSQKKSVRVGVEDILNVVCVCVTRPLVVKMHLYKSKAASIVRARRIR